MSALAKLSLLYEEATSAKQEVEYRLNGLNIAQAAYDQAIANYEAKRAAYYSATMTNFPPVTEGRMEASSSPNSDPSIKDFGGRGNSWLSMARQATSGKEQVGKLKAIFYNQIPKAVLKKGTRAAVVEWATNQGYVLPDLRAEEYIYGNRKEAESLNPKLFERLGGYRKQTGHNYLWLFFVGSTVRDGAGALRFPCLGWGETDTICNSAYLSRPWSGSSVLLVLEA